jgi:GntR family transcriptional repressor for pyruvate dehydrogenase complex
MQPDLSPTLVRERLSEQVAGYIESLVDSGKLQPGDRLPPERDLAETLHVGRGVIREAVQVLGARGLVVVRPGLGTFVTEMSSDSITQHLGRFFRLSKQSLTDLNELRQILEVEIATFAASRAQPHEIAEMAAAIQAMDESGDSAEKYVEADQVFHFALARASRNELFPLLLEAISDYLEASRLMIFDVPGAPQRGQGWHRRIHQAIERHDRSAARQAMREHMKQVAEDAQHAGAARI